MRLILAGFVLPFFILLGTVLFRAIPLESKNQRKRWAGPFAINAFELCLVYESLSSDMVWSSEDVLSTLC